MRKFQSPYRARSCWLASVIFSHDPIPAPSLTISNSFVNVLPRALSVAIYPIVLIYRSSDSIIHDPYLRRHLLSSPVVPTIISALVPTSLLLPLLSRQLFRTRTLHGQKEYKTRSKGQEQSREQDRTYTASTKERYTSSG